LDFERDPSLDVPYNYQLEQKIPLIQVDAAFNPFETEPKSSHKSERSFAFQSNFNGKSSSNWESMYAGLKQDSSEIDSEIIFEEELVSGSLFEDMEVETKTSHWYQLQKKYIVCPLKSSLTIIHQNRAHQRVLYEMYLNQMTVKQAGSQQLLFPLTLNFTTHELSVLTEIQPALFQVGFDFQVDSHQSILVSGIPVQTQESEVKSVFERLIQEILLGIPDSSFSQNDFLAKTLAKSMAVKNGTYLSQDEIENLVNGLFACKDSSFSPFQKPIFISISVNDLDKKFSL
jgi:DNA mismatch repair protein MutL